MRAGTICLDPSTKGGRQILEDLRDEGWCISVDTVHQDGNINFTIERESSAEDRNFPTVEGERYNTDIIEELKRISDETREYEYKRGV